MNWHVVLWFWMVVAAVFALLVAGSGWIILGNWIQGEFGLGWAVAYGLLTTLTAGSLLAGWLAR